MECFRAEWPEKFPEISIGFDTLLSIGMLQTKPLLNALWLMFVFGISCFTTQDTNAEETVEAMRKKADARAW